MLLVEQMILGGGLNDTTPNVFSVPDVSGAELNTQYSASVTPTGYDALTTWTVSGGGATARTSSNATYANSGTLLPGETLTVQANSTGSFSTSVNVTVTIGGLSDTWTITTRAADVTPNAFALADVSGATGNTQYTATVTPSGYDVPVSWSISGGNGSGQGSVAGGTYTTSGTISPGQSLTVRATSANTASSTHEYTLTIGGISDVWSITTGNFGEATFSTVYAQDTNQGYEQRQNNASWTVPAGVTSVCVLCIGGGGGGSPGGGAGGGGGALVWKNNIPVTPGQVIPIKVGGGGAYGMSGGDSSFNNSVIAYGGRGGGYPNHTNEGFIGDGYATSGTYTGSPSSNPYGRGGTWSAGGPGEGSGGGNGGAGGSGGTYNGGGGAGGYTGNGGDGAVYAYNSQTDAYYWQAATSGNGGGGGGGWGADTWGSGGGGGVGANGAGANGTAGIDSSGARSGGGGSNGGAGYSWSSRPHGGYFGGGGGQYPAYNQYTGRGHGGFVRILWGPGRAFPNNAA